MYLSEYCDVDYEENYNVVLVKWKKFCCKDDYRKPLEYALEIIRKYKCDYVADTRNGFENIPEDTRWVADYFMPKAVEYGCNCIYFIIDENNSLQEELEGQASDSAGVIKFRYIYGLEEVNINEIKERITLCGDNCIECPRYNAHSDEELRMVAKLWYKVGWRNTIVSNDEIACQGCYSHKDCTYHLIECTKNHSVDKCNECYEFPCVKIKDMLERSDKYKQKCLEICSQQEYTVLERAFFNKENNLKK